MDELTTLKFKYSAYQQISHDFILYFICFYTLLYVYEFMNII